MFKELKLKIAARRVERKKVRKSARTKRKNNTFWARVRSIICRPFRMIAKMASLVWAWIRSIDLVGLVNLTLLVAIIVLFSLLVIDIVGCNKKSVVIVADAPAVAVVPEKKQVTVTEESAPAQAQVQPQRQTLPLKRDVKTRKYVSHTVTVANTVHVRAAAPKQLNGDIIIDRRGAQPVLTDGVQVNGNLYLQNMRKYTLPCGTVVRGNLFLRDVEMLQFCGDFVVTGNIYVSPRSSFGPIPRTARLGGQVIL
ncbi:MAG: hypothetical protein K2I81_00600 [Alphaproteobacteria bacterium]|nr:hypothetical protein [Alphaproteobacteria bacterium]